VLGGGPRLLQSDLDRKSGFKDANLLSAILKGLDAECSMLRTNEPDALTSILSLTQGRTQVVGGFGNQGGRPYTGRGCLGNQGRRP